ncbi:hypothetical protein ACFQ44_08935 [Levilactobacillus lanxiensis]|uniref:Extracellular protein n=1 Tax=Levilactobacillus lanxiensis TaxID=2799568 RepID=A0ABW4D6M3_9LACO|nr:hypothetical protein [Levilactobacillus lanxiensis]
MNKRLTLSITLLTGLLLGSAGLPVSAEAKTTKTVPTQLRGYYKHGPVKVIGQAKAIHLTRHYVYAGPYGKGYFQLKVTSVKQTGNHYSIMAPKYRKKPIKLTQLSHNQLQFSGQFPFTSKKKIATRTTKTTFKHILYNIG